MQVPQWYITTNFKSFHFIWFQAAAHSKRRLVFARHYKLANEITVQSCLVQTTWNLTSSRAFQKVYNCIYLLMSTFNLLSHMQITSPPSITAYFIKSASKQYLWSDGRFIPICVLDVQKVEKFCCTWKMLSVNKGKKQIFIVLKYKHKHTHTHTKHMYVYML